MPGIGGRITLGILLEIVKPLSEEEWETVLMHSDARSILISLQERGYPTFGWMELLAERSPEILEAFFRFVDASRNHEELSAKVDEFIVIALDAVVDWPSPYIDVHINSAYEAGASFQELMEVVITAGRLMGPHTLSSGLTALDKVSKERTRFGLEVPQRGNQSEEHQAVLSADPHMPTVENRPFPWMDTLYEAKPALWEAFCDWRQTAFRLQELPRRVAEFIIIAIDAVIDWPEPYIDSHVHAAFDAGSTRLELIEVIGVCGRLMGPHPLNSGLLAIERVIADRKKAGLPTPISLAAS